MGTVQILSLIAIGASVGALTYYVFFRKHAHRAEEQEGVESAIGVPVPALPQSLGGKPAAPQKALAKGKSTPIQAICTECEKIATLPFRCKFCVELFCGEHRLPESHGCESL